MTAFQTSVMRVLILSPAPNQRSSGRRTQFHFQETGNRLSNLLLHGEHPGHLAVVAFRPQVIATARMN